MRMSSMSSDFSDPAFGITVYKPETGQHTNIILQQNIFREISLGHLQYDIPIVVYEACPEFPSAERLGMKVNSKQTAKTYPELLKQDKGNRVIRPDLVSDQAYGPYDPTKPRRF